MSYYTMDGLGEATAPFDGSIVWTMWTSGDASRRAGTPNGQDYAATMLIQAALNTLGYTDPSGAVLALDGVFGPKAAYAFAQFATAQGATTNPGCPGPTGTVGSCPTQDALIKMQAALSGQSGSTAAKVSVPSSQAFGLGIAAGAAGLVFAAAAYEKHKQRRRPVRSS